MSERKFTREQIALIRQLRREGFPVKFIAARFGVGKSNITRILARITYKDAAALPCLPSTLLRFGLGHEQ